MNRRASPAASAYDSVYLGLALILDARLATADRKLTRALRPTPWRDRVQWVGDVAKPSLR